MTKPGIRSSIVLGVVLAAALMCLADPAAGEEVSRKEKLAGYRKQRRVGDLQVGDKAPDFKLESADGSGVVQLSSFEGKRDVVLIFGSYT